MAYTFKYGSYMSTSGASNFIRPYIYYQITATAEQTTITWWAGCNIKSNYTTNAKITMKVSCTDKGNMSATVDNRNWGGGNHAMVNNAYVWTRGTANVSKTITAKMSTNVDSSTVSLTFTIYARGKVAVSFDTDGGSAVADQLVFYNITTALTSATPTKTNYTFLGWATTSGGTAVYQPGSNITATANTTLYAVWKSAYTEPAVIGEANAYRVASRSDPTLVNSGTIAFFSFTTDKGYNVSDYLTSFLFKVNGATTLLTTSLTLDSSDADVNVYSGYVGSTGDLDVNQSYTIQVEVTLTDINSETHTITAGSFISAEVYEIDISADGKRVSFGHFATDAPPGTTRTDFGVEIFGDLYLGATLEKVVDFVVEEGKVGDTTYRKWKSGMAECWIKTTDNVAINTAYGSSGLYQGPWFWTFPFPFVSEPTVTCSQFHWGTSASWGQVVDFTTDSTGVIAARLRGMDISSRASGSCDISAYAIGMWK